MDDSSLTPNEKRLEEARLRIAVRAGEEARWIDGREVIVTGPGGNFLSDIVLVMPAEPRPAQRSMIVGRAEAIEMSWEELLVILNREPKVFGPGTGVRRGPVR